MKNILTYITKSSKLIIVYLVTVIVAGSILTYLGINNISNFKELTEKRITEEEKAMQISQVASYQALRNSHAADGLKPLQAIARARQNIFEGLLEAVKTHSLGQISHALYAVGGEYRRNM